MIFSCKPNPTLGSAATWAALLATGVLSLLAFTPASAQTAPYRISRPISGGDADGLWDYATIDNDSRRLYLAQSGVTVLDLDSGIVTAHFVKGVTFEGLAMSHQILPANAGQSLAVSDAGTNAVDFFDSRSGVLISSVSLGPVSPGKFHNPDGIFYEPTTHFLVSVNGDSSSLSLIDTKSLTKTGDIPIGKGKLETGVADGAGLAYVNLESSGSIAVVDVSRRKLVREFPMKNCEEPTGLAYDSPDRLLISVCSNGLAKFIASESGKELASLQVGKGSDALIYDPRRHFVFSFGGESGTLSIIALKGRDHIALLQTLKTQPSARLGALDPKTGRVYIPAAIVGPPAAPIKLPGMEEMPGLNPHTFKFIVVEPTAP